MRVWDLPPCILCRNHLLGEHREVHAIWNVIVLEKKGYSKHPETIRWKQSLCALYLRHERLVKEMTRRGYIHSSPLDKRHATGNSVQKQYVDLPKQQLKILKSKNCTCMV